MRPKVDIRKLLESSHPKVGKTTFIAVDGHGGSGKSSLASLLSEMLSAEIIRTDDFASWDNPLDWWPLLIDQVFIPIKNGAATLSYERTSWWDTHHPKPAINEPVSSIMILEGISSLRREFREYISVGILVDTPAEICRERV